MKPARYYVRRTGSTAAVVITDSLPRAKDFALTWARASGVIHEVVDREAARVVYAARAPRTEGIPLPAPYNRPDPVMKVQSGNVWFDRFINGEDV